MSSPPTTATSDNGTPPSPRYRRGRSCIRCPKYTECHEDASTLLPVWDGNFRVCQECPHRRGGRSLNLSPKSESQPGRRHLCRSSPSLREAVRAGDDALRPARVGMAQPSIATTEPLANSEGGNGANTLAHRQDARTLPLLRNPGASQLRSVALRGATTLNASPLVSRSP